MRSDSLAVDLHAGIRRTADGLARWDAGGRVLPSRSSMRLGGRLSLLLLALAVIAASCAAAADRGGDRSGEGDGTSEGPAWAGFVDIEELDLVAQANEAGIDTYTAFVLRGSPADVDRALRAAEFDAEPVPGLTVTQPPLEDFEPEALGDVVSGEDRWQDADGRTLQRFYVRGEASDGQHVIHVWAFTT